MEKANLAVKIRDGRNRSRLLRRMSESTNQTQGQIRHRSLYAVKLWEFSKVNMTFHKLVTLKLFVIITWLITILIYQSNAFQHFLKITCKLLSTSKAQNLMFWFFMYRHVLHVCVVLFIHQKLSVIFQNVKVEIYFWLFHEYFIWFDC